VAAAARRDKILRPILQELAGQSLRAIAADLDRRGGKSCNGKPWSGLGQECDGPPRLPDNKARVMTHFNAVRRTRPQTRFPACSSLMIGTLRISTRPQGLYAR
jgi:hypothetical protein